MLKYHHMGIVVNDIHAAAKRYSELLGLQTWEHGVAEDKVNGVLLLSLMAGDTFIELVQPTRDDNRFARQLKEQGEGMFHLCFNSDNFDQEVARWKELGCRVEEEMAHSFDGPPFKLAWIPPADTTGVWVELCDH